MSKVLVAEHCRELITCLPLSTVSYAFAYGSAALPQKGENTEDKMMDLVICTRDPLAFHSENMEKNPSHYSLARLAGVRGLLRLQCSAARVYYNTHVRVQGRLIKYGIISEEDLKADLLDWKWMYIAGRLHKPVINVLPPPADVDASVAQNRMSALQAALLMLPDNFTPSQLYEEIVALSYRGDFRMIIGEDKAKVHKIVAGSTPSLEEIYLPLLHADSRITVEAGRIVQDASTPAIYHRLNLLPYSVISRLQRRWNRRMSRMSDAEEVLFTLARRHDVPQQLQSSISAIVRSSSIWQSAKNALTAGVSRSLLYSAAKLAKWSRSLRR